MQAITTVGLDIAKSVFQVHGVGADGHVVIHPSRRLSRKYAKCHECRDRGDPKKRGLLRLRMACLSLSLYRILFLTRWATDLWLAIRYRVVS